MKIDFDDDIIDMIICAIIFVAVLVIMLIALGIVSNAKAPTYYPIAGICKKQMQIIAKAENRAENEIKEERQRLAEEKAVKKAYEQRIMQIFGYLPTRDAIYRAKLVCMAEGGNTESIQGLERIFEVIANRCRSSRFPNTIDGVLYQQNQFETVSTGRMWQYSVNKKVEIAWDNLVSRGYCNDKNVLFFTAGGYNAYCRPAYKLGNHYFGY